MYAWLVTLHLIGLTIFLMSHAMAMFTAFRIRGETDRTIVATLLAMSLNGNRVMYAGLLLLAIGGFAAGAQAGLLLAPWMIASYVVTVAVVLLMGAIGASYYYPLREGLEGTEKTPRLSDEELVARLRGTRRPELLLLVGGTGLLVLTILMTVKPGT